MEKKIAKEVMNKIIDMINRIESLERNTQDDEMRKYFLGFKDGLDWVQNDVLRNDRIKHKLIVKEVDK